MGAQDGSRGGRRARGSASPVRFQVQEARLTSGSGDWDAGTRARPVLLLSPRLSRLHRLCCGEASVAPPPLQDWKGAGDLSQSRGLKEHGRVVTVNTRPDPSHFPGSPSLCPLRSAPRAGGRDGHGAESACRGTPPPNLPLPASSPGQPSPKVSGSPSSPAKALATLGFKKATPLFCLLFCCFYHVLQCHAA